MRDNIIFTIIYLIFFSEAYVFLLLGVLSKLWEKTANFVVSVIPSVRLSAWNNSAPTGRILVKHDIWVFIKNRSKKFKFL
jgi:hypothetical protein